MQIYFDSDTITDQLRADLVAAVEKNGYKHTSVLKSANLEVEFLNFKKINQTANQQLSPKS